MEEEIKINKEKEIPIKKILTKPKKALSAYMHFTIDYRKEHIGIKV